MKGVIQIPSNDGKNKLHVVVWEPETEIKAILQISHGMIEYIERYEEFANFLNSYGILVLGNDHLGHGHTAEKDEDLGFFGAEGSKTVVDDLYAVTILAKQRYGNVPYFLFGHSMGSFMARRYLMTYGDKIDGAIICGTGYTPGIVLGLGTLFANVIDSFKGKRYRSPFLKNLSFSGYNKHIKDQVSDNDWLSRNKENVERYNSDKYCTFTFTVDGYQTLFGVLKYIQNEKNYRKIPKTLPIFMIAGLEDPVGNYGEGVKKVFNQYKNMGVEDITIKLYEEDRHELTNEIDREKVYTDVRNWIEAHIKC